MIILNVDLDNTLIYSYKHDIGNNCRNVELYEGREVSFITEKTYSLLQKVREKLLLVPTSTRTIEQYNRINLGIGNFQYALVCNGGILLRDGERDEEWYRKSQELITTSKEELEKAKNLLEKNERRYFDLRYIEELFIFTKCKNPESVVEYLKQALNTKLVDIFSNGEKVYVVPCKLNKGTAVRRFREMLEPEYVIAAGDSEFDRSMVEVADMGIVPFGFEKKYGITGEVYEMDEDRVFSESVLEMCLKKWEELT